MTELKQGFHPVIAETSKVLILGTMPSEESLKRNEYYANPRNAFWIIMADLLGFSFSEDYDTKINILLKNRIALWDVIKFCERRGSLDSDIKNKTIIKNSFSDLFNNYPDISHVCFNGSKAEKEYKRLVLSEIKSVIQYYKLPSTSPAMAQLSLNEKRLEWSKILLFTVANTM